MKDKNKRMHQPHTHTNTHTYMHTHTHTNWMGVQELFLLANFLVEIVAGTGLAAAA